MYLTDPRASFNCERYVPGGCIPDNGLLSGESELSEPLLYDLQPGNCVLLSASGSFLPASPVVALMVYLKVKDFGVARLYSSGAAGLCQGSNNQHPEAEMMS